MKQAKLIFLTIVSLAAALNAYQKTAVETTPVVVGAQVLARGNAYLGADESNSLVFQNYSLLAKERSMAVGAMSTKLLNEFNYTAVAFSMPGWAVGYYGLSDWGGYERDENNNVGDKITYSDYNLYAAYGFAWDKLLMGFRYKYISKSFGAVNESAKGSSFDFACSYPLTEYLRVGAEVTNFMQDQLKYSTGTNENLPRTLGLGTQFNMFGKENSWSKAIEQKINVFSDIRFEERGATYYLGSELWPNEHFVFRAGLDQSFTANKDDAGGIATELTLGAGLVFADFYFDYAYHPYNQVEANNTHFFSLTYRFNHLPEEKATVNELQTIQVATESVEEDLTVPNRVTFPDIIGYPEQEMIEDLATIGILKGYPDGYFRPEQYMTRRELFVLVVKLLKKEGRTPVEMEKFFRDINYDDLFGEYLKDAGNFEMMVGYPDGTAQVMKYVRRDEAACVFTRYDDFSTEAEIKEIENQPYKDVKKNHWGVKHLERAKEKNLILGVGNNLYLPKEYLRRVDAVKILARTRLGKEEVRIYKEKLAKLLAKQKAEELDEIEPEPEIAQ